MKTKKGISLIVLVITIIVMIILAAAVIVALDNSNVINKANEAVSASNIRQVQELANTIWMDAYLDPNITTDDDYKGYVIGRLAVELEDAGKKPEDYYIKVTAEGVTVKAKDTTKPMVTISADRTSVQAGGTVVYTVSLSDNVELASLTLIDANITLNGFTATKEITGEGNVRTITLTNIQGEVGSKTITIAAGVAKDTSNNVSDAVTGGTFAIEEPTQSVAKPRIVIMDSSGFTEYYTEGKTITLIASVTSENEIASINIQTSSIELEGGTATISVTGEGNTRTIKLENPSLPDGVTEGTLTIKILAGAVKDVHGNESEVASYNCGLMEEMLLPEI